MDHQQNFPGRLTEIYSGWSSPELDLVPGEGFWNRIEEIAVKGDMTRGLDTAMQGQPSPRIWLFLHEPGRGELSAAVAMSFARELAFRDQAVLMLDCDDRDQALTRWVGRIETEGWIDLARYGTSVLTSGVALPFVGRRGYFLGVGSFAPTDVSSEEVNTLLTRLRRQGDDILLVAPSDFPGLMWAPSAAIRIYCWDQQTLPANEASIIAAGFAEAGCPLTAVVTFCKSGPAEDALVEQVLSESADGSGPTEPAALAPPENDIPEDPVASGSDAEKTPQPVAAEDSSESQEMAEGGGILQEMRDEAGAIDLAESDWVEPLPESDTLGPRETSRVFWFGALAAVVLIAAISIYYFKFVRVQTAGPFEPVEVATQTAGSGVDGDIEPAEAGNLDSELSAAVVTDSVVVAAEEDRQPELDPENISGSAVAATDSVIAETVQESTAEPNKEVAPAVSVEAPTGFDMAPYRETVGSKGWALHVYSISGRGATDREVQELNRRGFRSEVRVFDLGDKGIWNRIYLGSFSSRTQANQAMPALLEKLRVKWAKAVKF